MNAVQTKEAQKKIARLIAESISQIAGESPDVPTIAEFLTEYLPQKLASSELRESTKDAFEYQTRRNLIPAFGEIRLDKFGNADWNRWVREMRASTERHKQITRFFNARKSLMEILHAAKEAGVIERVPRLDNPDERRSVGRVLTDKEIWLILRNTTYPIFRVFFYTLYKMGCRPREILKWEWSMMKKAENGKTWIEIPARITKTARSRQIPVNPTVAKHLCKMLKENPNARFVFQNRIHPDSPQLSYHGAWRTALAKAKIKHCVPYDMRRTKITRAMVRGEQPVYVAKLLDTSVNQIQNTYTKDDAATLEALVE